MPYSDDPYNNMGPDAMHPRQYPNQMGVVPNPNHYQSAGPQHYNMQNSMDEAATRFAALAMQKMQQNTGGKSKNPNNVWGGNVQLTEETFQKNIQVVGLQFSDEPQVVNLYVSFKDQNGVEVDNPTNAFVRLTMGSKNGHLLIPNLSSGSHTVGGHYISVTIYNEDPADPNEAITVSVFATPGEGPISWTESDIL